MKLLRYVLDAVIRFLLFVLDMLVIPLLDNATHLLALPAAILGEISEALQGFVDARRYKP